MEEYINVVAGSRTEMTRIWQTKDEANRDIEPIPLVKIDQSGHVVVLTERHLRIALEKWFSKEKTPVKEN